ncbi:Transcriptional regulator, ArsR family [Bacillus cereus]|nr:Transcriptional regulator, ArsR family [Bacillus cereus]ARO63843.1 Transcriptional regulator, ArsR family [Bacillus cereus]ASI71488.1 hypothetical protein BA203_04735 [Bacillus cereus]OJE05730.1 hypothetical protein A9488_22985 [Bacillus cereus]ONG59240.1 hypothetical protein BKL48_26760 [Bacillus cereus]
MGLTVYCEGDWLSLLSIWKENGSLSVFDLSKQTRITEDLIVQHLRKLAFGNIVISERIGKRLHFKIKDNKTMEIIRVTKLILITFDINAFAIT